MSTMSRWVNVMAYGGTSFNHKPKITSGARMKGMETKNIER